VGKSTEIAVILRLRDEMGGRAAKALDTLTKAARGVGQGVRAVGITAAATDKLMGGLGQTTRQAAQGVDSVRQAAATTARPMDNLGRTAQKAAQGVTAVGRATEKVRGDGIGQAAREADKLGREMNQAARSGLRLRDALRGVATAGRTAFGMVRGIGRGVGQAGAGVAAGAMVAGRALAKPISFEKRLALMANTAYADRDVAGRIAGKKELEGAVNTAVRQGGGSRDQAAEALDAMLASGAVKEDTAKRLLPTIQKFATASGAGSGEIAEIVIRGLQQKFFSEGQAGEALDKAMAAGQAGGFELRDMAKWLPKMMALGSGMKSMAGFEQILAYSQAAAVTAGSRDEAGNNLVNLLQKLNSQDTQKDFARLGIDLTGALTKARGKGILPLEAFARLVEKEVAGKDPRYKALQKRLGAAKGDEKKQILSDMADLANASAVGKVVQDRQALLALIAAINQKDYIKEVLEQILHSQGTGEKAYQVYQSTTAASMERAANESEIARSRMLGDVSGPLKAAANTAADLAQRFPTLATAATEAATAIGAMSAAAAAFGAMQLFTGRAGSGGATAAAGAGSKLRWAGRAGNLLAGIGAFFQARDTEHDDTLTRAQKNARHAETAGGLAGTIAGGKLGAMLGTAILPGWGTAIGGVLGAVAGGFGGDKFGRWLGHTFWDDQTKQDAPRALQGAHKAWGPSGQAMSDAQRIVVEDKSTLHVESVLHMDGREVARVVNNYNTAEAKRD
jgi:hypothetical protein